MPFVSTDSATFDAASNSYSFRIAENTQPGSVIGRVAFDGGAPGTTYFTLTGPDRLKVRLDDDGTLRLADGAVLDFEALPVPPALHIDISALFIGDDGGFDAADTSGSSVTVTDVDEAPSLTVTPPTSPVDEHSAVGTVVGTLAGSDEDGDAVTYSLSGTHAALFSISGSDIVIADSAAFDFEALGDSVDVTVTATSAGSSPSTAAAGSSCRPSSTCTRTWTRATRASAAGTRTAA